MWLWSATAAFPGVNGQGAINPMDHHREQQMTRVFTRAPCLDRVGCDRIGLRIDECKADGTVNARPHQTLIPSAPWGA